MKKSEKISAISGISLLVVAALFLVALLLQLIPFANRDAAPLLNGLGGLLYGAYGYSSLLIPVFFFAAGLGCFLFPWSEKIGVLYASSCFPFFTIVACEKVCTGMLSLGNSPLVGIQVAIAIIVCILLLAIEYFGASCLGVYVQKRLRAEATKPLESKATDYPPIFPQGIIQEHLLEEDDEVVIEDESAEATFSREASLEEIEDVPFEERELFAEEQFHTDANLLLDEQLSLEASPPLEIKIPAKDEITAEEEIAQQEAPSALNDDLEETQIIESIYVQDELSQPVSREMQEKVAPAELSLRELGSQQEIPLQSESVEAEQITPVEAATDTTPVEECQQEVVEDVFGEDFFATAPVPEEDVFSKEYIEEFQLQRKACQKESVDEATAEDLVPLAEQETRQVQENQLQEEAVSEPAAPKNEGVVQFQPIPKYSLDPTPLPSTPKLNLDSPELEDPGEAAFFEDPFGDNSGVMDNSVITQATDLADEPLQMSEPVAEAGYIVNDEHHLLDDSIVRQSREEADAFQISFDESENEAEAEAEEETFLDEDFQEELEDSDEEEVSENDEVSENSDDEAILEDDVILQGEEVAEDDEILEDDEIFDDDVIIQDEAEES